MNSKLKAAREKIGLTQTQVASIANVTEISYQRMEYGKQTPRLKTAFIIAHALQSTVDELFNPEVNQDYHN